ncbi:MAG TPA: glycosyltransferase [Candidatus Saccharimonadales bacterium]
MARDPAKLKVAIVHDWLVGGGAERVVQELHQMFPDAPIYTSYATKEWQERLDGKVVTGFLQHGPFPRLRKYVGLLRIWWFTHLDFTGYDLVISSSGNGEAKSIRVPKGVTHVCYCHAPTHYYWRHYKQYLAHPGFGVFDPLARLGLRLLVGPLRRWDLKASKRPDVMLANSTHTQAEIKEFYGRDSIVVYPPIDLDRFAVKRPIAKRKGYITVGRQTPYKKTDIIVAACTKLGVPLTVIGGGPENDKLRRIAGPTITFPDHYVPDSEVPKHMQDAKAFLFAAYEDFGVTPVEALAAGTPVIAYKAGGALDYVVEGKTGHFYTEQTVEALCAAMQESDKLHFDHRAIAVHAQSFSPSAFQGKLTQIIKEIV